LQIYESKELSEEKNLFLKNLRSNLDLATAKRTVDAYKAIKEFESKNAYIYRLAGANPAIFRELMSVSDTTIKEIVVRALAEEGGWLRDRDIENAKTIAKKMVLRGRPINEIVEDTGLSYEIVSTLA